MIERIELETKYDILRVSIFNIFDNNKKYIILKKKI